MEVNEGVHRLANTFSIRAAQRQIKHTAVHTLIHPCLYGARLLQLCGRGMGSKLAYETHTSNNLVFTFNRHFGVQRSHDDAGYASTDAEKKNTLFSPFSYDSADCSQRCETLGGPPLLVQLCVWMRLQVGSCPIMYLHAN